MLPDGSISIGQKYIKMPKMVNFARFRKSEANGQTVLPDRSISPDQKLAKNAKISSTNETFCGDF